MNRPGWSRQAWSWEYRATADGPVAAFWHVQRIAELDWSDLQAASIAKTGHPLPDDARPTEAERLAALFRTE